MNLDNFRTPYPTDNITSAARAHFNVGEMGVRSIRACAEGVVIETGSERWLVTAAGYGKIEGAPVAEKRVPRGEPSVPAPAAATRDHICEHCGKKCVHSGALAMHERHCKSKPAGRKSEPPSPQG